MASAGDTIGEAEAATTKNRRRISDYLGDSDRAEASPPSPETPPQLRLPRFTCARFRFVKLGRKRGGRKEVASAVKSEDASVDSSGCQQAGSSSTSSAPAGMGLGMLLLLARTWVERNRMAEVRAQMETLLKEIRDEGSRVKRSVDHVVATPRTCNLQSSATTASSSCTSDTTANRHATTSSPATETERQEDESKPSDDDVGCAGVVDMLETESEAEPAQRQQLEFNYSAEQETSESSDEEFIELEGGRFGRSGNFEQEEIESDDSEEEYAGDQDGGVSATELERRLHELLHQRDRERIEELESALQRAELKLVEKEMEARMWQDTATFALQPRDGQ